MEPEIRRLLYEVVLAPGEGVVEVDEATESIEYERIDGGRLRFHIPFAAFEANLRSLAKAGRSQLGDEGSEVVDAGRWLNFVMMEKANDMSPVGRRGYQLMPDGQMAPWD